MSNVLIFKKSLPVHHQKKNRLLTQKCPVVLASFAGKEGSGPLEGGRGREVGGEAKRKPESSWLEKNSVRAGGGKPEQRARERVGNCGSFRLLRTCCAPATSSFNTPPSSRVVMYGCESWTIKKAECRRIDAFE